MGIAPGEPWGTEPTDGEVAAATEVRGSDRDLARFVASADPGTLIRFRPDPGSDLARGIGLGDRSSRDLALTLDALAIHGFEPSAETAPHAGTDGPTADRKSTRLNSSHVALSRMPSSA